MNLALFDLDGTLIDFDSDHVFAAYLADQGWVDREQWRERNDRFYADYLAGTLDVHAYVAFTTAGWRARPAAQVSALRERFVRDCVAPRVGVQAQALVERHRQRGDRLAIVTATNVFVAQPIAALFGVAELIGIELRLGDNGHPTGEIAGVPSYREGKVVRVQQWLAAQGLALADFAESWFYSDSSNDLPLLHAVTHPVAVNPDAALQAHAHAQGWPVIDLYVNA